jgi:D-arabinose 1-dehydrogenase-like Zn-dependent alcohol dehydrogenase
MCQNGAITGVTKDGGYSEYVLLRTEAVVKVPTDVDPVEYAPILCAGITVFNFIRRLSIPPGELVVIQGLGGLGHLAVQYADKMGYKVVVLSSGDKKRDFAHKLGAHEYIDASKNDPAKKLMELGGAALIVCTAPNPKAISPLTGGLEPGGRLLILAPCGPVRSTLWILSPKLPLWPDSLVDMLWIARRRSLSPNYITFIAWLRSSLSRMFRRLTITC